MTREIRAEITGSAETPEELLRSCSVRYRDLCLDAHAAFSAGKAAEYVAKLRQSARLIAKLPDKIRQAMSQGQVFPEAELREVMQFSGAAQKALADNNTFAMGVLLIDKGSTLEDPNNLDKLIAKIYPEQTHSTTTI